MADKIAAAVERLRDNGASDDEVVDFLVGELAEAQQEIARLREADNLGVRMILAKSKQYENEKALAATLARALEQRVTDLRDHEGIALLNSPDVQALLKEK